MKTPIRCSAALLPVLFLLTVPAAPEDRPPVHFSEHLIADKYGYAYGLAAVDIAVAGYASNVITWYRNPGKDGWDKEWPGFIIGDKMSEARTIRAGDFNGDGKIDLLCTAVGVENVPADVTDVERHGGRIVWY